MLRLAVCTEKGDFEIELHSNQAPETCRYFLQLAESKALNHSQVFRIVNASNNQAPRSKPVDIVQIGSSKGLHEARDNIVHESTMMTGLRHRKWSVSAARYEPGVLYRSFFICMREEPELDYGGSRHSDELGFAVFGHILVGQQTVKDIFSCAESNEILSNPLAVYAISINEN